MLYYIFFKYIIGFIFILSTVFYSFSSDLKENMVLIPSGEYIPLFKVGNEKTELVYVRSFMIDKFPVTNKQYYDFLVLNSEWSKDNIKSIFADSNYLSHWDEMILNDISYFPVINVSWFSANAYCDFYNKRLPTIDEWEYVASSSSTDPCGKNDPKYLQDILNWYTGEQISSFISINDMSKNYWNV